MSEFMNRPGEPDFVAGEGEKPEPTIDWLAEPLPEIKTFRDAEAAREAVREMYNNFSLHLQTLGDEMIEAYDAYVKVGQMIRHDFGGQNIYLFHPLVGSSFRQGQFTLDVPGITDEHGEIQPLSADARYPYHFASIDMPNNEIRRFAGELSRNMASVKSGQDIETIAQRIFGRTG